MKKPQCKDTCVKTVCQAFYRQYMLSPEELCNKKCYKGQNFTQWYQILLKLTFQFLFLKETLFQELITGIACPQTNSVFQTDLIIFFSE